MIKIEGTQISMTRGDTLAIELNLVDALGFGYEPSEGDEIRFAMKTDYADEECVIRKVIPNDTLVLRIESEETKSLPQPSNYVYDIQITKADGTVDTFIDKARLKITEEVD